MNKAKKKSSRKRMMTRTPFARKSQTAINPDPMLRPHDSLGLLSMISSIVASSFKRRRRGVA